MPTQTEVRTRPFATQPPPLHRLGLSTATQPPPPPPPTVRSLATLQTAGCGTWANVGIHHALHIYLASTNLQNMFQIVNYRALFSKSIR